jgi:hypothetical protein
MAIPEEDNKMKVDITSEIEKSKKKKNKQNKMRCPAR